jgi:SAM-dependent methyltransferase
MVGKAIPPNLLPFTSGSPLAMTVCLQEDTVIPGDLVRFGTERLFSGVYGTIHDLVAHGCPPYRRLLREIVELVEATAPRHLDRSDIRIFDLACGEGALTFALARAGFSVTGVEPFGILLERTRRQGRRERLPNASFLQIPLTLDGTFRTGLFDYVVNVHSLYAHPAPEALLRLAHSALKPGGRAIVVNFTRPMPLWSSVGRLLRAARVRETATSLPWLVANALFETARNPLGRHYWSDVELTRQLERAGFIVLDVRRTFIDGVSALAHAQRAETGA